MPVEFRSTLVKWGNSVRLVSPKPIRDGMKLKAGVRQEWMIIEYVLCFFLPKKKIGFVFLAAGYVSVSADQTQTRTQLKTGTRKLCPYVQRS